MDQNEARPSTLVFAEEELGGKMLSTMMIVLESQKTAWSMMSESAQETFLNKARENMRNAVREAVTIIATNRQPAIQITLDSVKFTGKGVEAKVTTANTEASHELADHAGAAAFILLSDPNRFEGGTQHVTAKKDQATLVAGGDPEIRKNKDGSFTCYLDNVPLPEGKGFKTEEEAKAFLAQRAQEIQSAADAAATKKSAPPAEERKSTELPAIIAVDGGWRVSDLDGQPEEPFATHEAAEAWLQEHLKVGKFKEGRPFLEESVKGGFVLVDQNGKRVAGSPKKFSTREKAQVWLDEHFPQDTIEQAPPADGNFPFPPDLETVKLKFREAGEAESKEGDDGDFDAGLATVKEKYPPKFIEKHLAELEAEYAAGFDKGMGN